MYVSYHFHPSSKYHSYRSHHDIHTLHTTTALDAISLIHYLLGPCAILYCVHSALHSRSQRHHCSLSRSLDSHHSTHDMDFPSIKHLLRRSRLRGFAAAPAHHVELRSPEAEAIPAADSDVLQWLDPRFYASLNEYSPEELSSMQSASQAKASAAAAVSCALTLAARSGI
jgi:hypothetical protein